MLFTIQDNVATGLVPQYTPTAGKATNYSNVTFSALSRAEYDQKITIDFLDGTGESVNTVTIHDADSNTAAKTTPIPITSPAPTGGTNNLWNLYDLSQTASFKITFEYFDPRTPPGAMTPSSAVQQTAPIAYGSNTANNELALYILHSDDIDEPSATDYLDSQLYLFFS